MGLLGLRASLAPRFLSSTAALRGHITRDQILQCASQPIIHPSYCKGPYRFQDREYMIIMYESDADAVKRMVPEPLEPLGNVVLAEWIAMPDSTGFGDYQEAGIVIPCLFNGERVNYTANMYLNCEPPIAAGREIWGFPKKYAKPQLKVDSDTLLGVLHYADSEVARGTMAFKHKPKSLWETALSLSVPSVNLKFIPDVDWTPKVAQLVKYKLCDVDVKESFEGPARLHTVPHVHAPWAELPVRKIIGGKHILADLTLPYGEVIYDYTKAQISDEERASELASPNLTRSKVLQAPSMPISAPSFTKGPFRLHNREIMRIRYQTDPELLAHHLPQDLVANDRGEVIMMWLKTHACSFGAYQGIFQYIPCTLPDGSHGMFLVQSYVNNSSAITAGREIYGFGPKFAHPDLRVANDTLKGVLNYGETPVMLGTMEFKTKRASIDKAASKLANQYLYLKTIPSVTGQGQDVAQLVAQAHSDLEIYEAWEGKASLDIIPHVNCPLSDLPVRNVIKGEFMFADLTLDKGSVVVDYLEQQQ